MNNHIETVKTKGSIIAIIIRNSFHQEGIEFFTPNEFSQQLAYMNRKKGHIIPRHLHNPVPRQVLFTREFLYIKSGKVKVDLYDNEKNFLTKKVLSAGDVILLADGGHGFEMLKDSEIIEIKQGPYGGDIDKTHF